MVCIPQTISLSPPLAFFTIHNTPGPKMFSGGSNPSLLRLVLSQTERLDSIHNRARELGICVLRIVLQCIAVCYSVLTCWCVMREEECVYVCERERVSECQRQSVRASVF